MASEPSHSGISQPITAEAVSSPRPLQFGLRTLMLLMAVCSVQFAVMSYCGVAWGMFVGTLACCLAFGIVFIVGLCLSGQAAEHVRRLDLVIVWLMASILILFFGTMMAGGGVVVWESVGRIRNEARLESSIGAGLMRETLLEGSEWRQVLRVTSVRAGGPADQAGLKLAEVIVVESTIDRFYQYLEKNRGSDVDLTAANCGPTQPLDKAPKRTVTVSVPK
jgi:hypothetical protein